MGNRSASRGNHTVNETPFSGVPSLILEAWRDRRIELVTSPDILDEYKRVGEILGKERTGIDLENILYIIALQ